MRIIQIFSLIFCALLVAACSDDEPTGNDNGGGNNNNNNNTSFANTVTGTINGNDWSAANLLATRHDAGGVTPLTLSATGLNESNVNFGIAFGGQKSFVIDNQSVQGNFRYGGKEYGENTSGSINITTLTPEGMRGTFSITGFTMEGEQGTANGNFDVSFN